MFIPMGKDNPVKRFPLVTACLIAVNGIVFAVAYGDPYVFEEVVFRYGLSAADPTVATAFLHMFLHGDAGHLAFNMLYMWVFGPNVEDLMGRPFYLVFYLCCGLAAALLHLAAASGGSQAFAVLIGASGAISGLMGAYFVLFPMSRIMIFPFFIPIHAFWFILIWIYMQLRSQMLMAGVSNVAYMAHIGGFVFGAGMLFLLMRSGIVVVPHYDRVKRGRYAALGPGDELDVLLAEGRRTGDTARPAAAFAAIMQRAPHTPLAPHTLLAGADAAMRAGDYTLAVAALRRTMAEHPHTQEALRAGIAVAGIARDVFRDPAAARAYLTWVIDVDPASPYAAQARDMLHPLS